MEREKSDAVRKGFENSSFFVKYYHRLPAEQQKEWIARLEKVAGRKVEIFDPKKTFQEYPRKPYTVPAYLPLKEQEILRNQRRESLKKAGIDPSVEGL